MIFLSKLATTGIYFMTSSVNFPGLFGIFYRLTSCYIYLMTSFQGFQARIYNTLRISGTRTHPNKCAKKHIRLGVGRYELTMN